MKVLSKEELASLARMQQSPSVSLYMPTHRTGDTEQDPIRLKNLLRQAEEKLAGQGLRTPAIKELLKPGSDLLADSFFWQHQGDGLAMFASRNFFRYYRLPFTFTEKVIVTERFHLKPLIPVLSEDGVYYILAISQKQVRLLQCSRFFVRQITPEEVPGSLADALKYDQFEKQLQFRSATSAGDAMYHGHGQGRENEKNNALRFFQQINRGLREVLNGERAPLVLAAVDYQHSIYREANSYQALLAAGIEGNPDELSDKQLQEKAWRVVEPIFRRQKEKELLRYKEAVTIGLATDDIMLAAPKAFTGQISTLFTTTGAQIWGSYNQDTLKVTLADKEGPGTQDMLDFTAVNTLMRNGLVFVLPLDEMPGRTAVAAIFRY